MCVPARVYVCVRACVCVCVCVRTCHGTVSYLTLHPKPNPESQPLITCRALLDTCERFNEERVIDMQDLFGHTALEYAMFQLTQ